MNNNESYTTYYCDDESCLIHSEMPRYIVKYQNNLHKPFYKIFCLNNLYVQVDFMNDKTLVSRLDLIFLLDDILIPKAINFDLSDQASTINKLKTIVNFS